MKKYFILLICLTVVFGMVTSASALSYTNTKDIDQWLSGAGTFSWTQPLPAGFAVPPASVSSATLTIEAWGVGPFGSDKVYVEGVFKEHSITVSSVGQILLSTSAVYFQAGRSMSLLMYH